MAAAETGFSDLSGFWTGVYDYPLQMAEPTPFNAVLEETGGALSGEIVEPDTMCHDGSGDLFASLTGMREGPAVSFVKRYEARPGAGHAVEYAGEVDAALTVIRGRWRYDGWSGPFVMNRSGQGAAASIERRESVEL